MKGLSRQVERALAHGATLHLGGKALEGKGNFFEPTILTHVARDNPAYFEEFFGPVAQVYVVKNDDEAVELANDSRYGLAGAMFSRNIERAKALASRIETGAVWINNFASTAPELPFGGVKRSGYGRELSELGIKEFVNQKLVLVATPGLETSIDPGLMGPGIARPRDGLDPACHHAFCAYCISPLPNDQSSRATSTRLIQTSSLRTPTLAWMPSAMAR